MATKAGVFNNVLIELGHAPLADTGEAVEAGRLLNQVWPQIVHECLSVGSWNFAMESVEITGDTGIAPAAFGFGMGFAKPTTFVKTVAISEDEYFNFPLMQYYDDDGVWWAENSPLYVRYVSSDTGKGMDLPSWPSTFTRFVELELAARVAPKLTQNGGMIEQIERRRDKARLRALNLDAMNEAQPKFAPPGSCTMARGGRAGRERGSRGSLIG